MATPDDVLAAAQKLSFEIPPGHQADYLALLKATDQAVAAIMNYPDYQIPSNANVYPPEDVHRPLSEDNKLRGWAWKVTIKGKPGGILDGKTICLKDTICVANVPQLFGTTAIEDFVPVSDATVVTRVLDHGGIIVGKAMCEACIDSDFTNFSHGGSSHSTPFGPVENPYAVGFSAGGSSSGCGALIGSNEVDMGIGGDQGGSIRIPAALCGIIGLKPTFGLVPYTGVLSSDPALDTVGPMARTALDAALLLQVIAGYDTIDDRQLGAPLPADVPKYSELLLASRQQGIKGLRIGILKEGFASSVLHSAVNDKCRAAIAKLEAMGAVVEEVSVPLQRNCSHSLTAEMAHIINKLASSQTRQGRQVSRRGLYVNEFWEKLLPWTQDKFDKAKYYVTGTAMSAEYGWSRYPTAYGRAMNLSRRLRDEYNLVFESHDIIVMPTVLQPARRHIAYDAGPLAWAQGAPGIVSNTAASNLTCHPSISFPVGFVPPFEKDIHTPEDADIKLPCGLMAVGKPFDEITLLRVVDAFERIFDWKTL
ncbi:amidase signature domain-containing protein [Roridomyces roridus]|uniref:Amidase signature domain-containing protein n=1 Tax=Roridomyces roridus TaxID=1738132 RepID=A0AAD7C7Z7_9AGAR|nr:amidase signature domain-containing protein [Roridomyces roridus]